MACSGTASAVFMSTELLFSFNFLYLREGSDFTQRRNSLTLALHHSRELSQATVGPVEIQRELFLSNVGPLCRSSCPLFLHVSFLQYSFPTPFVILNNEKYQQCYILPYIKIFIIHIKNTSKSSLMTEALVSQNILPPNIITDNSISDV
jgi:hypothetical protein